MKSTHDDEDMREMMNGGWGQRFATIQAEEFTNGVASICTPKSSTSSSKKYLGVEKQCPYLSFGTSRFEIGQPVRPQWPFENHGPLRAMAKNE